MWGEVHTVSPRPGVRSSLPSLHVIYFRSKVRRRSLLSFFRIKVPFTTLVSHRQ